MAPETVSSPNPDLPSIGLAPERFGNAARFYTQGRPRYPLGLIRRVGEIVKVEPSSGVLDLGTGPGFLALDFAALAHLVVAIEPSDAMLTQARANAVAEGRTITFIKGVAGDVDGHLGRFRLATIGRAFHWMDRKDTLDRLETVIEPGGGVALFSDRVPRIAENPWADAYQALRDAYATTDAAHEHMATVKAAHIDFLLASAFDTVERISVFERRLTPLDRFVDRILSYGAAWAGGRLPDPGAVRTDVEAALGRFATDGVLHEVVEGEALIGLRRG